MKSTLSIALALAITSSVNAVTQNITEVENSFKASGLVPDVLSSANFSLLLNLEFPGGGAVTSTGLNFTQPETSFLPSFSIHGPEAGVNLNSTFVLVNVDPDAPTPQNRSVSEVLHFMGGGYKVSGNISDHGFMLASNATAVMPYFPPSPPNTSDPHRYAWLIYESTDAFSTQALVNPNTTRLGFNLQSFARSVGFGDPLGGTFFFLSTNPAQVGTSTGILSATPTTTPTSARASASAPTSVSTGAGSVGSGGHIHLTACMLVVPLVALLL